MESLTQMTSRESFCGKSFDEINLPLLFEHPDDELSASHGNRPLECIPSSEMQSLQQVTLIGNDELNLVEFEHHNQTSSTEAANEIGRTLSRFSYLDR